MAAISGEFAMWLYKNRVYSIEGSLPFELGKSYPRRDGKMVRIIAVSNTPGYETVLGDDGATSELGWRYNREHDRGRSTGSAGDFSDPLNLRPDFPEGHPDPDCEGFLVNVSLMGANKPLEDIAKFNEILVLEGQVEDALHEAMRTEDWEGARRKIMTTACAGRIQTLLAELGIRFSWYSALPSPKRVVFAYRNALEDLLERKRVFYLV